MYPPIKLVLGIFSVIPYMGSWLAYILLNCFHTNISQQQVSMKNLCYLDTKNDDLMQDFFKKIELMLLGFKLK